jgi:hypothetical protein
MRWRAAPVGVRDAGGADSQKDETSGSLSPPWKETAMAGKRNSRHIAALQLMRDRVAGQDEAIAAWQQAG